MTAGALAAREETVKKIGKVVTAADEALTAAVASGDQEKIKEAASNAFGTRQCRKKVLGITTHNEKHDLRAMLTCNLTDKELAQIRTILANIGVAF